MKLYQWTLIVIALAFFAANVSDVLAQDAAQTENTVVLPTFDVPEGKDAKFYDELQRKFLQEYNEAVVKLQDPEGYKRLLNELGDADLKIFRYLEGKTDAESKQARSNALYGAIQEYAPAGNLDALKKCRELATTDDAKYFADSYVIPLSIHAAVQKDDKDAIKASLEEFFAKSGEQIITTCASNIHAQLKNYDAELAKEYSDRVVETFKDGEDFQKAIAERFVGRKRFDNLVGADVKVEGIFLDGDEIDWDSYRGKVVLIDFWATWCPACVAEFPEIQKLYDAYREKGFEVLGYALDRVPDELKKFEDEGKMPSWKTISLAHTLQANREKGKEFVPLDQYYGIYGVPASILVDKDGKAIATNVPAYKLRRLVEDQVCPIDESVFDVPDGKDLAFYKERGEKIEAAVGRLFEKVETQEEEDRVVGLWRGALTSLFKNAQDLSGSEELCENALASLSRIALVNRDVECVKTLLEFSNETYRERLESLAKQVQTRVEGRERFENLVGNEMKVEGLYLDGTEIDWSAYRGKVVLVDFWATWCGPCLAEIPNVLALYEKYHDAGLEVLGYSIDRDVEALKKFEEERKLPWKTASEPLSVNAKEDGGKEYVSLSDYYNITGVPTMILIDKDGKVVDTNARGAKLEELLQKRFPDVK